VWNKQAIPEASIPRIFQRNFSTKPGAGRGLGTFVMKLFGEIYLGGTVQFTTGAAEGTTFTFHLPRKGTAQLQAAKI
jgi:signal transduction histidine kinase